MSRYFLIRRNIWNALRKSLEGGLELVAAFVRDEVESVQCRQETSSMMTNILDLIDEELARLQQVRGILSQNTGAASYTAPAKRGRKPATVVKAMPAKAPKKRKLTPEGRARIAEAVKRRWAAAKAVPKGTAAKKAAAKKSEVPF
jgi:hypothetical protein